MPRTKKPELTEEKVVSEPETEVAVEESEAKKNLRALIATYKESNPTKYAQKEKFFEDQLSKL